MKNNKETALDLYAAAAEAAYPGKGATAREIIASGWDMNADHFVDQARLDQMGYKLDTRLALNCARGIVERNRSLDAKLRALKS
jgi:hypothetical protein